MSSSCLRLLSLSLLIVSNAGILAGEETLRTRFLNEVPKAFARHAKGRDGIEGSFLERKTIVSAKQGQRVIKRQFSYWVQLPLLKFDFELVPSTGARSVVCSNSSYDFEIGKESKEKLRLYGYDERNASSSVARKLVEYGRRIYAGLQVGLAPLTVADLISDNRFRLLDIGETEYHGRKMVRIDFRWDDDVNSRETVPRDRWAFLDPADGWLVQEWHGRDGTLEAVESYEFTTLPSGARFPKRILRRLLSPTGKLFNETEDTLSLPLAFNGTEDQFRLSAYDLPEIERRSNSLFWRSNRMFFVGLNIFLLAVLGVIVFWMRRKRRIGE